MTEDGIFIRRYRIKTTDELMDITSNPKYLDEAKYTAIHVLEERGMATKEMIVQKSRLEASIERIIVQRRNRSRYDNFLRRLVAAIIDSFVLWPVSFLFQYLMITEIFWLGLVIYLVSTLFPYLYSILLQAEYGQTLGKMAMSIKVIHKDEAEEISYSQAILRDIVPVVILITYSAISIIIPMNSVGSLEGGNFVSLVPSILLGFLSLSWVLLELFSMLFDERKRAVHDLIAKTVVVRVLD